MCHTPKMGVPLILDTPKLVQSFCREYSLDFTQETMSASPPDLNPVNLGVCYI